MSHHDALFKQVFSHPEHVLGEIRHLLGAARAAHFDWATLRLLPASFVDEQLGQHHADLLYSVRLAGGDCLIYLLIEHKSAPDRFTGLQLLRYQLRIWERFHAEYPRRRLPPVLVVLVCQGRWSGPPRFRDLCELDPGLGSGLLDRFLDFTVFVDDLSSATVGGIRERPLSSVAVLALLSLKCARRRSAEHPGIREDWRLWGRVLGAAFTTPAVGGVLAELVWYIMKTQGIDLDELQRCIGYRILEDSEYDMKTLRDYINEDVLERGREEGREEGRAEGRAEGRREGQARLVQAMLHKKFGAQARPVEEQVGQANLADLDRWALRILDSESIEQVFAEPR